jgi:hypothetical protein
MPIKWVSWAIKRGVMNRHQQLINEIEKNGGFGKGRVDLLSHLNGNRITRNEAIKAKCYDCSGYYGDGRGDCGVTSCPLYGFMPYRGRRAEVITEAEIEGTTRRILDEYSEKES